MSTKTHPDDPRPSLPPSVVILGNDAQLAARPATPVQLAHACLAAGYRAVVPASWGDELIAAATIRALASQRVRPAIQCVCPHVARRVLSVGSDLSPYLISLVSPPVAVARYIRRHSPGGVRLTYVGRCPGAGDDSIDARLTPEELLAQLAERNIALASQPLVFESVIPPDRRRHRSQPGGLPSPESLWGGDRPTTVEIVSEDDLVSEIAEKVLAATNSLLDLAPSVGCVCSGAIASAMPHRARADVVALEPPRAPSPVVNEEFAAGLELPLPAAARSPFDIIAPVETEMPSLEVRSPILPALEPTTDLITSESTPPRRPRFTPPESEAPNVVPSRRKPNSSSNRVIPGSIPVASDSEGRVLPRAYVARRRSPRSGVPVMSDPPATGVASPAPRATPATSSPSSAAAVVPPAVHPAVMPSAKPPAREPQRASSPVVSTDRARVDPPTDERPLPRIEPEAVAIPEPGATRTMTRQTPAAEASRDALPSVPARTEAGRRGPQGALSVAPLAVTGLETAGSSTVSPPPLPVSHAPISRALDAELPIAQSREPTGVANGKRSTLVVPPLPLLVDQMRRTTERVSGEVRAIVARSPRTVLIAALVAFVLLGVAIGWAAARRAAAGTTSGGEQVEEPPVRDGTAGAAPGATRDTGRGTSARVGTSGRGATATSAPRRSAVRRASAAAPLPTAERQDLTAPPATASLRADSVSAAARDSAARAAARAVAQARTDSLAAEREALRRELAQRRARLDSIARRVQELKPEQREQPDTPR